MNCYANETGLNGKNACVALGMFDGVHLGHAALLKICVDKAKKDGVLPFVYTYSNSPHPQKQRDVQGFLTTAEEKIALCRDIGIEDAVVREFTPAYRAMPPEEFVNMLFAENRVSTLVCGRNYRFGIDGQGDAMLLSHMGHEAGVGVVCVDELIFRGQPISSTRVRKALLQGECLLASELLGRPYAVDVCIVDQQADWPPQKARIGPGRYLCTFNEITLPVTVQSDGIIVVHENLPVECRNGSLAFVCIEPNTSVRALQSSI